MKLNLPPDEYFKQLAKVPTSGGAIFRNDKGEFLLIKPSYKDYWDIPGGMSEADESPKVCMIREVREEVGIEIKNSRLFCVDFVKGNPYSRILFLFDCGILTEDEIKKIKICDDEISEYKFVTYEETIKLLGEKLKKRLQNSIEAFNNQGCAYLENGIK